VPSFKKREKPAEIALFRPPVPGPGGNPVPPGGKHPHVGLPPLATGRSDAGSSRTTLPARIRDDGGDGTSYASERETSRRARQQTGFLTPNRHKHCIYQARKPELVGDLTCVKS